MRQWFDMLAPREKLLIGLAGLCLVAVILIQFLMLPLMRSHAEAESRNQLAARTLAEISLMETMAGQGGPSQNTLSPDAFRQVIISTARSRGLAVSRIQSGTSGGIKVVMDEAAPEALFAWLAELESTQAISPDELLLSGTGSETGKVRVSIDFKGTT